MRLTIIFFVVIVLYIMVDKVYDRLSSVMTSQSLISETQRSLLKNVREHKCEVTK